MEYYEITYQVVINESVKTLHIESCDEGDAEERFYTVFPKREFVVLDIKVDHDFLILDCI